MVRIHALGGLSVRRPDGQPLAGAAAQPRRLAILALLARAGQRGVARDRVATLFWPDADEERARNNLAQALYVLRRELGGDDTIAGTKELRLDPSLLPSDVGEFCAAVASGDHARAVELYTGPFLEGFHLPGVSEFDRWAEEERGALAHDYSRALESLARAADARGDPTAATWWRRLAAKDPLNARIAVGLMEALAASGDRAGALRHARIYEVLLEQELDLPPDHGVVALAERLRREAETPPARLPAVETVTTGGQHWGAATADAGAARDGDGVFPPPAASTAVDVVAPRTRDLPAASAGTTLAGAPSAASVASVASVLPAATGLTPLTPPAPHSVAKRSSPAEVPGRRRLPTRGRLVAGAALISLAVVAVVVTSALRRRAPEPIVPGAARRVAFEVALELDPALSPNGRVVAYAANAGGTMRLYVKQVAGGRAVPVTEGLPGFHRAPRWSPDGTQLVFQADGTIYLVPAFGGVARTLVKPQSPARWVGYPAWSPDGRTLAYAQDGVLYTRAVAGGTPQPVRGAPPEPHSLAWSPDGEWIALVTGNPTFVIGAGPWGSEVNIGNTGPSTIWVTPARGGAPVRITDDRSLHTSPIWLPGGRTLLFVSNRDGERDVYRVDLGPDGRPLREPERVTAGLRAHTISVSGDGRRLAYSVFTNTSNVWELTTPAAGPAPAPEAHPLTSGSQVVEGMDLSPDGKWLAFDSDRDGDQNIYKVPSDGGDAQQLTSASTDDFMPAWSPDGREIAFHTFIGGTRRLRIIPADGGAVSPVTPTPRNQRFPGWSPDGTALVFASDATGTMELYTVRRRPDRRWGASHRLTSAEGLNGRWSPDGRLIAYTREDGIWTIAPDGGPPTQVLHLAPSDNASVDVVQWGRDGRTLYYKESEGAGRSSIWSVPAAGGTPRLLVRFDDPERPSIRPEFATDGRRFYFTLSERQSDVWTMELHKGRARRR